MKKLKNSKTKQLIRNQISHTKNKFINHFPDNLVLNPGGQEKIGEILKQETTDKLLYWFRGGRGAGKTFIGSVFILTRCFQDPDQRVLITANSYPQLAGTTLVGFLETCRMFSNVSITPFSPNVETNAKTIAWNKGCYITINNNTTFCYVYSSDAFIGTSESSKEMGRGIQIRSWWGDEYTYAKKEALGVIIPSCDRGSGWIKGLGLITSTINRNKPFNWAYDYFDNPRRDEDKVKSFESIVVHTHENPYLSDSFISNLKATLTPELYAIEVESRYISITEGRVFNYFDRHKHELDETINYNYDLHIGFDFNWNPATCLIGQKIKDIIVINKEFYLEKSDTFKLAREVVQYLIDLKFTNKIYVHGDASGNQKTANSLNTNWQIIWNAFKDYKIKAIKSYGKSNPSILDSVNSVNNLFHKNRLFIHSNCVELIKDLESLQWKNDKIDKSDLMRSHEADILRYIVEDLIPYKTVPKVKEGTWI